MGVVAQHLPHVRLGVAVVGAQPARPSQGARSTARLQSGYAVESSAATSGMTSLKAVAAWLRHYNHHRPHTTTGGKPPITRARMK
ncbi:integrase core domain-containing protein [Micromonospora eburnea]|uniref:integrase core domain-containing protein n=1 Tax=Micromonospora eburnea TaxID=227316 RepID=UPI000B82F93C